MYMKKVLILIVLLVISQNSFAEVNPHFVDFKFILNKSDAGKKAQKFLQNKLENGFKNIRDKEKKIQDEEKKLFNKKKLLVQKNIKNKLQHLGLK